MSVEQVKDEKGEDIKEGDFVWTRYRGGTREGVVDKIVMDEQQAREEGVSNPPKFNAFSEYTFQMHCLRLRAATFNSTRRVVPSVIARKRQTPSLMAAADISSSSSSSSSAALPPLSHILETCLYVRDVGASARFYRQVLKVEPFLESPRVSGFSLGSTTLLLFQLGSTASDIHTPKGVIVGHGPSESIVSALLSKTHKSSSSSSNSSKNAEGDGGNVHLKQHFCLAVKDPEDVAQWDAHLQKEGVRILGRMTWDRRGKSVYFEDPDGHVGEIGSRGIWAHYDLERGRI
ncbi:hypothetical protein T310_8489 [Rasamsonia emersonii CBS 393.64]|uniref:VOC domain-containing protein n=1 Tax=Rasamsonia emersonii (strain ATCC 16479 / CBS 393.64 / IMI 116815) TaxID=1408163 RepID=A0A0F4YIY6_RASE3|nr:hypothetical protein T310_8489 [Rasamsonia emersonii CBS 393.64]KKA17573.1 hypothetical protein T310_8489 [Rasamsonia emersonii CBS 393.64]